MTGTKKKAAKKQKADDSVVLHLKIPSAVYAKLKAIAERDDRSISTVARRSIAAGAKYSDRREGLRSKKVAG